MNAPPTIGTARATRAMDTTMNCTTMTGQLAAVTRAPRLSAVRSGKDADTRKYIAAHSDILRGTSLLPR
jgi:hypothetical protein